MKKFILILIICLIPTFCFAGYSKEFIKKIDTVIREGNLIELKQIIPKLKNINDHYDHFGSLLYTAVLFGKIEIVKFLIKQGVDPKNGSEFSIPLIKAVKKGQFEIVDYLYNLTEYTEQELTDAFVASASCHLKILKYFLNKGVNINSLHSEGYNALSASMAYDNRECFYYLLDKGAKINYVWTNKKGEKIIKNAIFPAIHKGKMDIIKHLLKIGANKYSVDSDGNTLLHTAATGLNPEVIHYLVKIGLDVNAKNKEGHTALFLSMPGFNLENEKALRQYEHLMPPEDRVGYDKNK